MKINKSILAKWLNLFGIKGKIVDTLEFINKEFELDGIPQVRVVVATELENDEVVVFKLNHENMYTKELLESQIIVSQKLREGGLNTTFQYGDEHGYVKEFLYDGLICFLTCERYMGSRPNVLTPDIQYMIGKELGRLQSISERLNLRVGFSRLYNEVMKGSSYKKVWRNEYPDWIDADWIEAMTKQHDAYMEEIREQFAFLPRSAVQGDVYGVNNVVFTEDDTLAIIDYNLASDEVLVGDFLLTWYRTAEDINMHAFINEENADLMWDAFSKGYLENRSLSEKEYEVGYKLSAVLGLTYMTRLAIELKLDGREADAKKCLCVGERLLMNPRWLEGNKK